jgi:hypothetical protein
MGNPFGIVTLRDEVVQSWRTGQRFQASVLSQHYLKVDLGNTHSKCRIAL